MITSVSLLHRINIFLQKNADVNSNNKKKQLYVIIKKKIEIKMIDFTT
jgi:hypothetical protein